MTNDDPEDIVRALANIPPDRIMRTGRIPSTGGMWARCVLCGSNDFHELTCPWFRAVCWKRGMTVEFGDRLSRALAGHDVGTASPDTSDK